VWSGIFAFGIIGPYFFEEESGNTVTVASDRSVHVVNEFLLPELRRRDIDLATFWFQQDRAKAHTDRQSMNTLRTVFEHRIISRYDDISWPAHLPDLFDCDFVSCGYMESKVFQASRADLHNLEQRIIDEINAISPAMLLGVMESALNRMLQCTNLDRQHLTGVMFNMYLNNGIHLSFHITLNNIYYNMVVSFIL
jgi:hypothetical protein